MLKVILLNMVGIISSLCVILIPSTALAQQIEQKPALSYEQQVQQMFNETDAQARSQFDKHYPKPSVPKTPVLDPSAGAMADKGSSSEKQSSTGWTPPAKGWEPPAKGWEPPSSSSNNNSSNTSAPAKTEQQNIYMPSGGNKNSNTNQAPNPYR